MFAMASIASSCSPPKKPDAAPAAARIEVQPIPLPRPDPYDPDHDTLAGYRFFCVIGATAFLVTSRGAVDAVAWGHKAVMSIGHAPERGVVDDIVCDGDDRGGLIAL